MDFVQKTKGYCDKNEEEEEDEEEEEEMGNSACDFSTQLHQIQWLENSDKSRNHEASRSQTHQAFQAPEATDFHGKLQAMDLSLRIDGGSSTSCFNGGFIEREHMFDKVVTPSDVGKLNRLVIPKQYAEKFFPLDSSTNEKGLILNFEDRNGKQWRFRYSYWNSSQSYVMTKGWSRFVKEKKLDAGDIVSFGRATAEYGTDRFFIDWRRRPDTPPPTHFTNLHQIPNPLLLLPRWSGRHYTAPPPPPPPLRRFHNVEHLQQMNYSSFYPNYSSERLNLGSNSLYYVRPSMCSYKMATKQESVGENQGSSMAVNSVSALYNGNKTGAATAPKRLRLFGVNMECPATEEEEDPTINGGVSFPDQLSRRGKEPSSFNWETSYSNRDF